MAKIYTKVMIDIATSVVLEESHFDYDGDLALCKGADVAQQQRTQELQMQTDAFNRQMTQLSQLQSQLSPYLSAQGQGYTPEQMATMRSQFLNTNAQQFQNAGQSVREALMARGGGMGDMPISGDYTRGIASLMGAAASSQAQGLLGLQQQNAMQALQNKMAAAGILSGNAQTLTGTQGVGEQGASSALQSYITARNSGLMQQFMGGLGAGLGAAATGGISAGLSQAGKSLFGGGSSGAGGGGGLFGSTWGGSPGRS